MSNIRGLAETVLLVKDIKASVAFYCDVLGLQVISPADFHGPVFLQAGGGKPYINNMIVLVRAKSDTAPFAKPQGLHHIGFEIEPESYDAEVARLQGLGLETRFGQHPLFASRTVYISDPDGNEIELIAPN